MNQIQYTKLTAMKNGRILQRLLMMVIKSQNKTLPMKPKKANKQRNKKESISEQTLLFIGVVTKTFRFLKNEDRSIQIYNTEKTTILWLEDHCLPGGKNSNKFKLQEQIF